MNTNFKNHLLDITTTLEENLKENFNVHEVFHNDVFAKAWKEYQGVEFDNSQHANAEYYASDFVWWVLTESKEECYNIIGLVDTNGNIYDWLKQPCVKTDEFERNEKNVICATVSDGENKGKHIELYEDSFNYQYILDADEENIYLI